MKKNGNLKRIFASLLIVLLLVSACSNEQNNTTQTTAVTNSFDVSVDQKITDIYNEKSLGLNSVKNCRELGGYKTVDGKFVINNLLVRSGHLARLSDEDLKKLKDVYNIKQIVDFRTSLEIGSSIDKDIEGATYQKVDIIEEREDDTEILTNMKQITNDNSSNMMISYYELRGGIDKMYDNIINSEVSHKGYKKFFDILLENDGATLFHCSSGKDRTGFAAAFLLSALGVDKETIINDYEASIVYYAPNMRSVVDPLKNNNYKYDDISEIQKLIGVSRISFITALDKIDKDYGGMDKYLRNQIGLTDENINTLKNKYLKNNNGGLMIKEISTKNAPAAIGPYSQAVMVNNTLYASGAIGVDPVTGTPAEGITGQAEQALKNIGAILKEAGYDYSNVVKTTCFLADMNDFNTFNEVYSKYFTTKPLPARSCVAVKTLPKNLLCEIEILAVK